MSDFLYVSNNALYLPLSNTLSNLVLSITNNKVDLNALVNYKIFPFSRFSKDFKDENVNVIQCFFTSKDHKKLAIVSKSMFLLLKYYKFI